jgi:hypothetical protein
MPTLTAAPPPQPASGAREPSAGSVKLEHAPAWESLHAVPDEHEATQLCLNLARQGDLVILTATNYEEVWHAVLSYKPQLEEHPA